MVWYWPSTSTTSYAAIARQRSSFLSGPPLVIGQVTSLSLVPGANRLSVPASVPPVQTSILWVSAMIPEAVGVPDG